MSLRDVCRDTSILRKYLQGRGMASCRRQGSGILASFLAPSPIGNLGIKVGWGESKTKALLGWSGLCLACGV